MVQYAFRNMSAGIGKARSQVGTTQDADGKVIKRRHSIVSEPLRCVALVAVPRLGIYSSIRDAHLCNVRIKASRPVNGTVVIFERLDEHTHTHDIEESFCIKKQAYCGTMSKLKQPKIIPHPKNTMQSEVQVHMKVQSG